MLSDVLFGPRIMERGLDGLEAYAMRTRSLTLDMESLIECAVILDRRVGPARFVVDDPQGELNVDRGDLAGLAQAARKTLRIVVDIREEVFSTAGTVTFYANQAPGIFFPENYAFLRHQIATHFLDRGTPRVAWLRLARYLTFLPFLGLLAAWIVSVASTEIPAPVAVFGWLIVASSFVLGIVGFRRLHLLRNRYPGHRIRQESRAATAARRADEKKNLKVALITAPITLAVGFVLAVALGLIGL